MGLNTFVVTLAASAVAVTAIPAYAPAPYSPANTSSFLVNSIYAYQPSGYCVDSSGCNYLLDFTVQSTLSGSSQSAYCWSSWSDNSQNSICYQDCVAYSKYAPTENWIPCVPSSDDLTDYDASPFSFHIYGQFGIGNYSLALRQEVNDTLFESTVQHISNTTGPDYTCNYNSAELTSVPVHAHGDCETAANFTGYELPVESEISLCSDETIPVRFQLGYGTPNGYAFVVGNITELGGWDISKSHELFSDGTQSSNQSVVVDIPANTPFEYRYYVQYYTSNQSPDGEAITWDCMGNHVFTTPASTCDVYVQASGNDSDTFMCCTHGSGECQMCGFGYLESCPVF